MDGSHEVAGREEEEGITPEQAFQRLEEWFAKYSNALTGISAVEAVREMREGR